MRYVPTAGDLEAIRSERETRFSPNAVSKGGNMYEMAAFPPEIHEEMSRIHGDKWYQNHDILAKFLMRNPQYKITNGDVNYRHFGRNDLCKRKFQR